MLNSGIRRAGEVLLRAAMLTPLLAGVAAAPARAQAVLFGRVSDAEGAPVEGAAVRVRGAGNERTTASGEQGGYRIAELAPGRYRVLAERSGYTAVEQEVRLSTGERRLDLRLRADTVVLEGVVVQAGGGRDRERARFQTEPGVTARVIAGEALKTLPGLAEADVLRAVEVLPGVVSTSDFSSAFNVRGGSADQNLILLDGVPVFNPFHLGGLFSVFNSDAIERAELLAGGFGAEYGGRVSSVLNVETEAGEGEGVEVRGGVSLLASRVLLRGPLPDRAERAMGVRDGRWMISARRSYFDQILRPVTDFPYHLTDLQAFAEVGLRGGGRLSFTAYTGVDALDLSDFQPPGEGADSASVLRVRWKWGNRVAGVRWQQALGPRWVADTRLGYSSFSDELGFVDFGGIRFASAIDQLSLRTRLGRSLGDRLELSTGGGAERLRYDNEATAGGTEFFGSADDGVLGHSFASLRWRPSERWLLESGLRADAWWGSDSRRLLLSPRFAAKRFLGSGQDLALKLAVGRYTQFLHSLRNEEFPISNDTWVLAGRDVPPVVSDQVQVGVERYWGDDWSASAEAYLRDFRGVTEFNVADDPNDPADDLLSGTGRSAGLDFLVRRSTGRLTGWTSVSLLRAERTLPDPLAAGWEDVASTTTFPPIYDRRVDVDVVLQYLLPGRLELGARWNYGSPLPYTRPVSQYFGFRYGLGSGQFEPVDRQGERPPLYVLLGQRNAERYPPYHRLDATLRRTFRPSWGSWTPYLQVLNVYNRRNVLFYFYNYDRLPATRSGISMFPVLPALGVEVSF